MNALSALVKRSIVMKLEASLLRLFFHFAVIVARYKVDEQNGQFSSRVHFPHTIIMSRLHQRYLSIRSDDKECDIVRTVNISC